METPPDFSMYSMADLRDAIGHIDREKYPVIYELAISELTRRNRQPSNEARPKTHAHLSDAVAFCGAIPLLWFGGVSVFAAIAGQLALSKPDYRNDVEPWFLFLIGIGPLALGVVLLCSIVLRFLDRHK